jgi:hypothetical protein
MVGARACAVLFIVWHFVRSVARTIWAPLASMQRLARVVGLAGDPILWTLTGWALLFSQRQTERSASREPHAPGKMALFSEFAKFKESKQLIVNGPELFYVFPDRLTKDLPSSLDDAFDQGFLVIACLNNGQYYLNIANEQYTGAFEGLALILFDWAHAEGYHWAPAPRVTLPGEPEPIRYRQTAGGDLVAWDEPGENF